LIFTFYLYLYCVFCPANATSPPTHRPSLSYCWLNLSLVVKQSFDKVCVRGRCATDRFRSCQRRRRGGKRLSLSVRLTE